MERWQPIFPQRQMEREIDDELDHHLEARVRDLMADGLRPDEARAEALRRFGDLDAVRGACRRIGLESIRAQRRAEFMDQLRQDLVYAVRGLVRRPGFAGLVMLILALGIGGTTAIYSVVDRVLLRPLPFQNPDRLAVLWGTESGLKSGSSWTSYPDLLDIEESNDVFTDLAFWSYGSMAVGGDGEPARVATARVSHNLFPLLGVAPGLGRDFLAADDRPGTHPVVILSYGFWENRLGADPSVVGKTLQLDGVPHTVVGVMPAGFDFPGNRQLWVPATPYHAEDQRGQHRLMVAGRLKPGVGLSEAEAEMQTIAARLAAEYPETNTGRSARLEPLHETVVGDVRPGLMLLLGAIAIVLLIVCANVANLLLARSTSRRKEVAIRAALGAGRWRIVRQVLTESLVLAGLGGAVGIALAFVGVGLLRSLVPGDVPRLDQAAVDGRVLAFAVLLTIATGVIFGLAPALSSSRPDIQGSLKDGGRASIGSGRPRMRQTLVIVETALAVLLLVGAGLFINSLWHLQRVDAGFTGEDVLVVPLSLPESRYALEDWQRTTRFYQRLVERVEALPGVRRAGAGYQHPLAGGWETSFQVQGLFEAPPGERPEARIRPVTPDYFRTAGIPLLAGRSFTDRDDEDAPGVVIINESFARAFFGNESPIGHRILKGPWWPFQSGAWEIIGVVGDVKMDGLTSSTPWAMYFAHAQMPFNDMQLLVAPDGDSRGLATQIRDAVWALDPQLPVENIETLHQIRARAVAPDRFRTLLLFGFAALAALLAAVGIYGILSYSVSQRVGEIGLRISLGASTRDVLRMVIRQGLRLSLVGLGLGLLGALATTRLAAGLLFEVSPTDPATFAVVAAGLTFVALVACTVPALRAARVDPMEALRAE